jgi:hypothetical protein
MVLRNPKLTTININREDLEFLKDLGAKQPIPTKPTHIFRLVCRLLREGKLSLEELTSK